MSKNFSKNYEFSANKETFDCPIKEKCLAARLRESTLQHFESIRDKETNEMNSVIESFKTRCIETSLSERHETEVCTFNASSSSRNYVVKIFILVCLQLDKSRSDETVEMNNFICA